jgi:hypothetical protein
MLKKTCLILFAVVLALTLATCNNYDELVTPIPVNATPFDYADWVALTTDIAGTWDAGQVDAKFSGTALIRANAGNSPTYTISPGKIKVSNRTVGYCSFDVQFHSAGVPVGVPEATITVKGKTSATFAFAQPESPWGNWAEVAADGSFELTATIPISAAQQNKVRIRTNGTEDYEITSIEVSYKTSYEPFPEAPSVPGPEIF